MCENGENTNFGAGENGENTTFGAGENGENLVNPWLFAVGTVVCAKRPKRAAVTATLVQPHVIP